jgi:SAM-dependent methyltransferase
MWSSAPWERVAPSMGAIHDRLVGVLGPRAGERWLDVGTGTGAVAARAARAGAQVTGVDLAPAMIETARRIAAEEHLGITFDVGDAEALPYPDASFDVVCSAHGVVFAPDHAAAARELARVCRPGGQLGMTAWRTGEPGDGLDDLTARFTPPRPQGVSAGSWGDEAHARLMLGDAFELEFIPDVWIQAGASGHAIWELLTTASPPFKALADDLDPVRRDELHAAWVEFYEDFRTPDGIRVPHGYVIILGRRRDG